MKRLCLFITSITLLISCSRNEEIISLSRAFFHTLADTTYALPSDYYPYYKSLGIEAKSDMIEIDESDIRFLSDTAIVRCFNSYTTEEGVFKQDSVYLYLITNEANQYYICDSQGLATIDKDIKDYGIATGAFPKGTIKDRELASRLSTVKNMLWGEYLKINLKLYENVVIQNWSWETSYSGTANGEARIKNNLDFAVEGIKYELTYYDYSGQFMAKDDGRISKTLYPGEKYSFDFWSSNVKYPDRANLKLVFPDRLIYKILKEQSYSGNEYNEYLKSSN